MSSDIPRLEQGLDTLQLHGAANRQNLHSQLSCLMAHEFHPLDIIFVCNVCGETLDSIYSKSDGNRGLQSTPASENGNLVKLWLTECAHLTCAKHLEGGEVPLHPADQQPRAACPVCSEKLGDVTSKELYAVHGLRDRDFNRQIPASSSQSSPAGLNTNNSNMEETRFQIIALWRYSSKLRDRLREEERQKDNLQSRIDAQEREIARVRTRAAPEQIDKFVLQIWLAELGQEHNMLKEQKASLERKVEELRQEVKQWDCWKRRQDEITGYLSLLAPLAREHLAMREQLWALGLDIPNTQDTMHLFGPMVRPAGRHRFIRGRPHDQIGVEEYGVLDDGSGTARGRSLTASPAANGMAAVLAFDDMKQARSQPDGPNKKQYMFGMKRQLPNTTTCSVVAPPLPLGATSEQHPGPPTAADHGLTTPHRHGNRSHQPAAPHQETSTGSSNQAPQGLHTGSQSTRRTLEPEHVAANRLAGPSRRSSDEEIGPWGLGRSRTRDRSHEFGTRYATPGPLTALSAWQDGGLDSLQRRRREQPGRSGPGLAANVRSSAPVASGPPPYPPPTRPLPPLPMPVPATGTATSRPELGIQPPSHLIFPPRNGTRPRTVAEALVATFYGRNGAFLVDTRRRPATIEEDDGNEADDDEVGPVISRSGRRGARR